MYIDSIVLVKASHRVMHLYVSQDGSIEEAN